MESAKQRGLRLLRDKRIVGAGGLASSALASSLITVAALPFVARLYTPSLYAQFALILAASVVVASVAAGRYEMACVVIPHTSEGDQDAVKVARMAVRLASGTCLGLAALTGGYLWAFQPPADTGVLLMVGIAAVFLTSLSVTQNMLDTRQANYRIISLVNLVRALILAGGQILFGIWWPSVWGLLLPLMASLIPSTVRLFLLLHRVPDRSNRSYRSLMREHQNFPKYQSFAALTGALNPNIYLFVLAFTYGDVTVGLFAMAIRITLFPATVINRPVNTVYFRESATHLDNPERASSQYRKVVRWLALTGVAVYLVVLLAVPIIGWILGSDWESAKALIVASLPMGLAAFLGAPASSALVSFQKQRQLLLWRLLLVLGPPLLVLAGPSIGWSAAVAVGAAAVCGLLVTVAFNRYTAGVLRRPLRPVAQ